MYYVEKKMFLRMHFQNAPRNVLRFTGRKTLISSHGSAAWDVCGLWRLEKYRCLYLYLTRKDKGCANLGLLQDKTHRSSGRRSMADWISDILITATKLNWAVCPDFNHIHHVRCEEGQEENRSYIFVSGHWLKSCQPNIFSPALCVASSLHEVEITRYELI